MKNILVELEFDKEIDAILRKARPEKGVLVGDDLAGQPSPKKHVDADAIAAFVENALPEKAKRLYMEHFADCDRCRKQLSFAMKMNAETSVPEKSTAAAVIELAVENIPWYRSIFRIRSLALTMGALVIAFSGILGYLVLQKQNSPSDATISQVTGPLPDHDQPIFGARDGVTIPTTTEMPMASTNAGENTAANSRVAAAPDTNTSAARSDAPAKLEDGRRGQFQIDGASGSENNFVLDGQETADQPTAKKPAAAPTIPSGQLTTDTAGNTISRQSAEPQPKGMDMSSVLKNAPATGAGVGRDEKKGKSLKEQDNDGGYLTKLKNEDRALMSNAPPVPQNKKSNQAKVLPMSGTRSIGGKTFSSRNGAWYDSTYHNQPTVNLRRGTNEYKALESGLRAIADTLGGTVVVMWKAKAYRIQ